jgi:hypothetical protein
VGVGGKVKGELVYMREYAFIKLVFLKVIKLNVGVNGR